MCMHTGDLCCATKRNVIGEYGGASQGDCAAQVQEGTDRLSLQPDLDVRKVGIWGGVDHAGC